LAKTVLITGGAGFLGSHIADDCVARGYRVRVLDSLDPHVHGGDRRPVWTNPDVEMIAGDVRSSSTIDSALRGVDVVVHFAACVTTGESRYDVERCVGTNNVGTMALMSRIARTRVERLILGSSMAVYGEGLYRDSAGLLREVRWRTRAQLEAKQWEPLCGHGLEPAPTPETKSISVASTYACSKYEQENTCLHEGRRAGVDTVVLRFFNVFGPRQSMFDPYAGELARIAASLLAGERPQLPEDGGQSRDFVPVRDAVAACRGAFDAPLGSAVVNVGTGKATTLIAIAQKMAALVGAPHLMPNPTGRFRASDVRHCFADTKRARTLLGIEPSADLDGALLSFVAWVGSRPPITKRPPAAAKQIDSLGSGHG
jgi:dTDP-L-rhamnose 4-epimerase